MTFDELVGLTNRLLAHGLALAAIAARSRPEVGIVLFGSTVPLGDGYPASGGSSDSNVEEPAALVVVPVGPSERISDDDGVEPLTG